MIILKRAYDPPKSEDGPRFLVVRPWPRRVKKELLALRAWARVAALSDDLRRRFLDAAGRSRGGHHAGVHGPRSRTQQRGHVAGVPGAAARRPGAGRANLSRSNRDAGCVRSAR